MLPKTYKPMTHQAKSLKHNDKTPIVFDTSDAGTGKTGVRIWAFAKRRAKGGGCMLVIASRSLLQNAWGNDLHKFAPHLTYSIARAANRDAAFAANADVYITNHDAAKWLAKQKPAFFKKFSELVIDESTAFKHHTSQRSKAMAKVAKHFKYRAALTATPNSNSITDVWHQALLLDGGARLGTQFFAFRSTVCTPTQVGNMANAIKWTDKDGAEEAVFGLLSDITVRHRRADCIDLPPSHQYTVPYELSPKQRRDYDALERSSILSLQTGNVTAINAAAVATKLLQVASGAVYDGTGHYHVVDTGRYDLVLDLCEERPHALVFFLWKHQRDLLTAEADRRGKSFGLLDGNTSDRDRNQLVSAYQAGQYDILFAHPKSAAHGLTLTRGTSTIWTSPTYDLEIFVQGSSRQNRIGQKNKTETIVVVAPGTLDEKVYERMNEKNGRMSNLLDLFSLSTEEMA